MAVFETWIKSDLQKPMKVVQLTGNLFSADAGGNLIGVEVFDDGAVASLSGSVMGYVIRADGVMVTVNGTLNANKASIVLPASAYTCVGDIRIAIKITDANENVITLGAVAGFVYRTTTDAIVDPGHVIPSLEELLAQIDDCREATDAANAAASEIDNMTVAASTGSAGSSASAVISEVDNHKHIAFTIPKGDTGATGATPDISIGTVQKGADAAASMTGTAENPVLNLTLPKGDKGDTGNTGADGDDAYIYVRYSATQPTQDSDMKTTPDEWMGIYSGHASSAPTTYTSYTWYKIKGETGAVENVYGSTVPMSSTDSTKVETAINGKADLVASATNGNFASLDANGNLTDSGHKHSDYVTDKSDKADKVTDANSGNFASLDEYGNLADSGHKHSDYLTTHQDVSGKANANTVADFANGNTHGALQTGDYVYIANHGTLSDGLYKATATIIKNGELTTSNTTPVSHGLGGNVSTIEGKLSSFFLIKAYTHTVSSIAGNGYLQIAANEFKDANNNVISTPSGYSPVAIAYFSTAGSNLCVWSINPLATGTTNALALKNVSSTAQTDRIIRLSILYMKN